jgi:GT2 family glycosyltransferase
MQWLEKTYQNSFIGLKPGIVENPGYWEAANSSIKREFIVENQLKFEESFTVFENLEFEIRARQHNAQVFYDPSIISYHFHPTSPKEYRNRMKNIGRFAKNYWLNEKDRFPHMASFIARPTPGWLILLVRCLWFMFQNIPSLQKNRTLRELCWRTQMTLFEIEGSTEV